VRIHCQTLPGGLLLRTDMHLADTVTKFYSENSGSVTDNAMAWYGSAVARPALVLIDLTAQVWPETVTVKTGCPQWFRNVMAGDMPIILSSADCAANEAGGSLVSLTTSSRNTLIFNEPSPRVCTQPSAFTLIVRHAGTSDLV